MQCQHADFPFLQLIRGEVAAFAKANEVVDIVPMLDHVQGFLDFVPQGQRSKITAQKNGLARSAQFRQRLVSRMLCVVPREAPQNVLSLRSSGPECARLFHHMIVLLIEQIGLERLRGEN